MTLPLDPMAPQQHRTTPDASSEAARRRMRATRQQGTTAELLVRAELTNLGFTFIVDKAPIAKLRSRADIAFPEARVAVFIDGCFWHCCPIHATAPKSNGEWWRAKLAANCRRDAKVGPAFHEVGWIVLRFWEHESSTAVALVVAAVVNRRMTNTYIDDNDY